MPILDLPAEWQHWLQIGLTILLILVLASILKRLARRALGRVFDHLADTGDSESVKRYGTLQQIAHYAINVAMTLLTVMLVLDQLGISIAPILAAAGVLGLAVGFGAQSLVKDYFTGLFLLLEDQVRQGDVVEIAGKAGKVEKMTLRYILLRDYEGATHTIPNGMIDTVTNRSRDYAYAVIDVGVAYREDVDEVFEIMRQEGAALRADPAYSKLITEDLEIAGVDQLADSSVMLRGRFKVLTLEQWGIRRAYLYRLKKAFDARGIEIPFPHLTVYQGELKDGSAPPLRMVQGSAS